MFSKQNWSIERVVVLLSPLFAATAAVTTAYIAKHFPGAPRIDKTGVTDLEIAGFIGAAGLVGKWLHGRQNPAVASGLATDPLSALRICTASGMQGEVGPSGPQGAKGDPGVTPEQVKDLVDEEVRRLLSTVAQS